MKKTLVIILLAVISSVFLCSCNANKPTKTKTDYDKEIAALIRDSAVVLDVRTAEEYIAGHVRKSINIPLDELAGRLSQLPTEKPIITVCRSGMRSSKAATILRQNGFKNVHDGGSWRNVEPFVK